MDLKWVGALALGVVLVVAASYLAYALVDRAGDGTDDPGTQPRDQPPTTQPRTQPRPSQPREPPPPPPPPEPFDLGGTGCFELLVQVPVEAASVEPFVPDEYTVLAAGAGQAIMFAGLKLCDDLTIDGESIGRGSTSDIGVLIEPPDPSQAGFHYYQVWWLTDNVRLWNRLANTGFNGSLVFGNFLQDARTEGIAGNVLGLVPWVRGAFLLQSVGLTLPAFPESDAYGWAEGQHGTVRVSKHFVFSEAATGPGNVTTVEGSPMAELMGATLGEGVVLIMRYEMAGRVDLLDQGG